jgi:hypothetical protein
MRPRAVYLREFRFGDVVCELAMKGCLWIYLNPRYLEEYFFFKTNRVDASLSIEKRLLISSFS